MSKSAKGNQGFENVAVTSGESLQKNYTSSNFTKIDLYRSKNGEKKCKKEKTGDPAATLASTHREIPSSSLVEFDPGRTWFNFSAAIGLPPTSWDS